MKKTLKLLPILSLSLLLSSCDWFVIVTSSSSVDDSSSSDATSSTDTSSDPGSSSEPSSDPGSSSSDIPSVSSSSDPIPSSSSEEPPVSSSSEEIPPKPVHTKTKMAFGYDEYFENSIYVVDTAPSLATANYLVIPIWFTDSNTFIISEHGKDNVWNDIKTAYFGTEEETGWHSVRSFYEKESFGNLFLDGKVTEWYNCGKPSSFYSSSNATTNLVQEATDWYFNNAKNKDRRANYDGNGDGYIDSVILVYAAPNYSDRSNDGLPTTSGNQNLWAYCFWLQNQKNKNRTNPGPNAFSWVSYDFMYGRDYAYQRTGRNLGGGDRNIKIDAHSYIHECGHLFGLDDYYDYGPYGYAPAGQFSMQDMNVGGHDPYSVMALGWADPYIALDPGEYTLKPFQSSGDLLLLTPEWNENDSPFDEYILVELYTPTGVHECDALRAYTGRNQGPTKTGIRVWHVDSRLVYTDEYYQISDDYITTSVYDGAFGVYLAFSNTYDDEDHGSILGEDYYDFNLLQYIWNDQSAGSRSRGPISNNNMFYSGNSFSMYTYNKQFVNGNKLNNGKSLGWGFVVDIEGEGEDAVATISLYAE